MAITAYLTLEILQALSAFSRIIVEWVGPLRAIRGLAAFLMLHLEILRLGCVLGTTSPVTSYVASLLVLLAFASAIVLQFVIHKWLLRGDVHRNALINALGLFVLSGENVAFTCEFHVCPCEFHVGFHNASAELTISASLQKLFNPSKKAVCQTAKLGDEGTSSCKQTPEKVIHRFICFGISCSNP